MRAKPTAQRERRERGGEERERDKRRDGERARWRAQPSIQVERYIAGEGGESRHTAKALQMLSSVQQGRGAISCEMLHEDQLRHLAGCVMEVSTRCLDSAFATLSEQHVRLHTAN